MNTNPSTMIRHDEETTNTADEAAIHNLFQNLLDSWCRGDGYAYADQFTEDADYIAFDGSQTRGRQEIALWHQQLFDKWLKGTCLTGEVQSIRFLSPEAAFVIATGGTLFPGRSKPVRPSIQSLVAIKRDGMWRFASFHNTRIQKRSLLQNILFGIMTKVFRR